MMSNYLDLIAKHRLQTQGLSGAVAVEGWILEVQHGNPTCKCLFAMEHIFCHLSDLMTQIPKAINFTGSTLESCLDASPWNVEQNVRPAGTRAMRLM